MIYEDLKGKRVLVTGSSSGIGAATAEMFARQGAFVGVHYFQTPEGAQQTLDRVKEHSDGCLLCADVRSSRQVQQMVEQFAAQAGRLDILVNNAGTMVGRQDFADADVDFYDDVFTVNTKSVFLVTRQALGHLKLSKGSIVNIGSVAGHTGGARGSGIYAVAKAAVAAMTMAMAKEFGKYGIRVNSVLPGLIETRFHQRFSTAEKCRRAARQTPLGRNGTADDVAAAVLFLASDAAAFITGEYIAVNGGNYMRV
ncbi:MAG TPA: glucose 1-dehydrogenase [Sedimentisphaerales bacterium]|nr:glucose 1-dehydrogenase [Sedimentisphaerales bacterium]